MMKAETKAKRRATLDLLGLGILDESETETIPGATTVTVPLEVTPSTTAATTSTAPQPTQSAPQPAGKTKLSAKAFNDLCARIRVEPAVYEKAIATCDLTAEQLATLNEIRSQLNSNPNDNNF
jgi:predicted transglutaminase-like cysteine proteinase